MKFRSKPISEVLDIIIVAHNLESLFYPIVESVWSAIPIGCRFLIGNFSSTDRTIEILEFLSRYAPITVHELAWRPETGGTAIGIATQELIEKSDKPCVLNLQACEILLDDVVVKLDDKYLERPYPGAMTFRHFWGGFDFDGSVGGRGYGSAFRVLNRYCNMQLGDGSGPGSPPGDGEHYGTIHRYSYCWDNQIQAKTVNHYELYHGDSQSVETRWESIRFCRKNPNYDGYHPLCVEHLRSIDNYDLEYSMKVFADHVDEL